jgi:hypothetical protein
VLHVVGLAFDESAEMEHDALSLVALAQETMVCVLQSGKLFLIPLTLAFELSFGLFQGKSWPVLLEAYTFKDGNVWPIVLLITAVAPCIVGRLRGVP